MLFRRSLFTHISLSALIFAAAMPAGAQEKNSVRINVDAPDSVAHVIERAAPATARFAIVSRDGKSALLLMDTTIVAQMTDHGLARLNSKEATDTIKGTISRLFARMALGALQPLFDHGIAYHLRDLSDARYADGRLKLLRANGEEVFRGTEISGTPLMESFTAQDATAFARRAKEARAKMVR